MRRCSLCSTLLLNTPENFRRKYGRPVTECRTCEAARCLTWRATKPEAYAASLEAQAERRRNDPEHRSRLLQAGHDWNLANRPKKAEYQARRRARIRAADIIEPIDRDYVYERDGGRCHICGQKVPRGRFHLDHLIPLSRGGSHTHANLRLAHPRCNQSRSTGRIPAQLLLLG